MGNGRPLVSMDSILLSVLVVANITLFNGYMFQKSFYMALLLCYVTLDFLHSASGRRGSFLEIPLKEHFLKQKQVVFYILVFFLLLWPALSQIYARLENGPEQYAHDGLIQTEEAVKMLLQLKNPYTEDYLDTPMASWKSWDTSYGVNPALYHFPYLPFLPVFAAPFYVASKALLGWFDLRLVYIGVFLIAFLAAGKMVKDDSRRLQMLMLFSLNPWFAEFFDEGRNDAFMLAWIVFAVYALRKNKPVLSSAFMAFACLTKQTAWIMLPFYFLYLMKGKVNVSLLWKAAKKTYPLFVLSMVFIVPFLVWDYSSFIDDILSYHSGTSEISYPAGGYGIATLLIGAGVMEHGDYFPFWILQLAAGVPMLWLLLRRQAAANSLGVMLASYGILTFLLLFLSRSFHDNYMGYIISVMAFAYYLDDRR